MTVNDLLEYALIGAAEFGNDSEKDHIAELLWRWRSESNTNVDLISFSQAFPSDDESA